MKFKKILLFLYSTLDELFDDTVHNPLQYFDRRKLTEQKTHWSIYFFPPTIVESHGNF